MMNEKVKLAIAGLLDLFREGNVPEKIAIATNPTFDVPRKDKKRRKTKTYLSLARVISIELTLTFLPSLFLNPSLSILIDDLTRNVNIPIIRKNENH